MASEAAGKKAREKELASGESTDTHDIGGNQGHGDSDESFAADLAATVEQAYPDFLDHLKKNYFADWHRKRGILWDLANQTVAEVMTSVLRRGKMPDNMLAYLLISAEHRAEKDWRRRGIDPLAQTASDPTFAMAAASIDPAGPALDSESTPAEPDGIEPSVPLGAFSSLKSTSVDDKLTVAVQSIELETVLAAMEALPPRQREVLHIYIEKGKWFTQRELAEQLEISEKNFQLALTRAGKFICKYLKERGFDALDRPDWGDVG